MRKILDRLVGYTTWKINTVRSCGALRHYDLQHLAGVAPRPVVPFAEELEQTLNQWANEVRETHTRGRSAARIAFQAAPATERRSVLQEPTAGHRAHVPTLISRGGLEAKVREKYDQIREYVSPADARLQEVRRTAELRREAIRKSNNHLALQHGFHLIPLFQSGRNVQCLLCPLYAHNGDIGPMQYRPCLRTAHPNLSQALLDHWPPGDGPPPTRPPQEPTPDVSGQLGLTAHRQTGTPLPMPVAPAPRPGCRRLRFKQPPVASP